MVRINTTSTRSPGWIKPATPRTSSTRTVTARLPGASIEESVAGWFAAVILLRRIGSFLAINASVMRRPSLSRASLVANAPSGRAAVLQGISTVLSAVSWLPKAKGLVATTIVPVAAWSDLAWLASQLRARTAATMPRRIATERMMRLLPRIGVRADHDRKGLRPHPASFNFFDERSMAAAIAQHAPPKAEQTAVNLVCSTSAKLVMTKTKTPTMRPRRTTYSAIAAPSSSLRTSLRSFKSFDTTHSLSKLFPGRDCIDGQHLPRLDGREESYRPPPSDGLSESNFTKSIYGPLSQSWPSPGGGIGAQKRCFHGD